MSIQPHMSNSSKDECSTGDFFFFYVLAVCMRMWLTGSQKISMSDGVTIIFFVQFIALCVRENVFLYMRWLYLRIYACIYVCIYVCIYLFMYVCMYVRVYMYVCTCIYVHIGLGLGLQFYVYLCVHTCVWWWASM